MAQHATNAVNKLLLLAEAQRLDELREAGGFPEPFFARLDPLQDLPPTGHHPCVFHRDPSFLDDPSLSEDVRDHLLAELLHSLSVNVVVLENDERDRASRDLDASDRLVLQRPDKLRAVVRWYQQFTDDVQRRMPHLVPEYRHVLVVVCADALPNDQLSLLSQLTSLTFQDQMGNPHRLFSRCYIMMRRLEYGSDSAYHAPYVWPIYVNRLLIRLLNDVPQDSVRGDDTNPVVYAWRAFEFDADLPVAFKDDLFAEAMKRIYQRVSKSPASPSNEPDHDTAEDDSAANQRSDLQSESAGSIGAPASEAEPAPSGEEHSQSSPAPKGFGRLHFARPVDWDHDPATDPDERAFAEWQQQIAEAVYRFGTSIEKEVSTDVIRNDATGNYARNLWAKVHEHPATAFAGPRQLDQIAGDDLAENQAQNEAMWQNLQAAWQEWDAFRQRLAQTAGELGEAKYGFVKLVPRLGIAAAVTLALSLILMTLYRVFFSGTLATILIGLAAGLGACTAVLIPHWLERRAGLRAAAELEGVLDNMPLDGEWFALKTRTLIRKGLSANTTLHYYGMLYRLRQLLLRVQTVLNHELQPQPVNVPENEEQPPADDGALPDNLDQRRALTLKERRILRNCTVLTAKIKKDGLLDMNWKNLEEIIENYCKRFLSGGGTYGKLKQPLFSWPEFCKTWDAALAGNLPAHVLIPELRDFCTKLRHDVLVDLYRQISTDKHLTEQAVQGWVTEMDDKMSTHFYYYLTCSASGDQVGAFEKCFVLRHNLPHQQPLKDAARHQSGVTVAQPQWLGDLPYLGVWIEETPVRLGKGADGIVKVTANA